MTSSTIWYAIRYGALRTAISRVPATRPGRPMSPRRSSNAIAASIFLRVASGLPLSKLSSTGRPAQDQQAPVRARRRSSAKTRQYALDFLGTGDGTGVSDAPLEVFHLFVAEGVFRKQVRGEYVLK